MKQLNWYQIFGNTHTVPDGKTVTPTDDIQTLLHCANIWDKSYTTLAEVLADDDTLFLICISNNAIDYLVRSTSWAVPISVPTMTSNTTPSGMCSATSTYSGRQPYYAFDKSTSNSWMSADNAGNNCRLVYGFSEAVKICKASFYTTGATVYESAYKVQGSNDGVNWTDLYSGTFHVNADPYGINESVEFDNNTAYEYYGLLFVAANSVTGRSYMTEFNLYSASIPASESAMQYIGASDYASETLLSDSTWLTAIDGSAYKDYVINAKVPNMTSATTPSGEVISSGFNGSYPAWKAFDGNDSTQAAISAGNGGYIGYKFASAKRILGFRFFDSDNKRLKTLKIQGSNDNNTWTDLTENIDVPDSYDLRSSFANTTSYLYYRIYQVTTASPYTNISYMTVQFYGRENAGVQSWLKAGGITNKKYTTVSEVLSDLTTLATLMSSTDAIDYLVTAKGWATEICSDSNAMADIGMNNYAANTLLADSVWCDAIVNSTYSSSVLNVSVPTMTDNTHPYGECFVSMPGATEPAWKAFDGNDSSVAVVADVSGEGYIGYEFVSAVKIVGCYVDARANSRLQTYKIQGSNDGTTWNDISEVIALPSSKYGTGAFANTTTYKHIRLYQVTKTLNNVGYYTIQFYGRKDI